MALKNVSSYIKNLGKSVKYAAADEFEKRMPATSEFMQTNQEVFQTVYKGFSDIKGSFSLVKRKVEKSKFYEAADVGLKAIMEDLKTGQFYNTTREGEMSVKAMGIDLSDMGDEDFNFDDFGSFDDDTSNSKESKPKSTGVSVIQSSSRQSAELVSDTIARTGSAIVESNKASTSVLYQQNLGLMSQIHSGIFSMSKMMNDNFSVIGGNFKTYAENSTKFYESVTNNTNEIKAMLGELLEMERNRYSTAQQEEKDGKSKKISYGDIVGSNGTPDLKAYFGRIMQNTKSVGGAFSILDSFEGNALAAMVASPLKFIPEAVVKAVIPATVGYAAEELDKSIGGIFANLIGKFNEMSTSENNVLSTIGKLFGVKSSLKSLKPTKIDANPVPFDNVVREAIVTEIPTYLRKILSYISGEEEMIFNRDSGQFVTGKELQKQLENVELSNISSAFSDFNEEMDKLIAKIQFATGEDRKQFDKTRKKINTAQFRKGFVGNMQNMDFEKAAELYGLSYEDEAAFYVFKNLFKNISKSNTMQLAGNIMSSRENYNRSMDDLQSRGVYGALSNNSNVGQFVNYDKYGNNLSKDIKGFGKDGKGPGPLGYDKLGHDIFFYLQNMLSELINIRNGLGYIGIKKGKGGKSGTPVNIPFGTVSSNIAKDENFIDPTSKSRKRERDALDKETAKYKRLNDPNNNERYKKNIILLDYDAEDSSKLEGHIQGKLDNVFMTLATQKIAEDRFENFKADNRYKDLSGAIVKKLDEIALEADKKINSKEEFNVEPTKEDMKDDEDEKKKKQFKDPKELLKAASEIVKKPSKWVTDLLVSTEGRIYNLFFGKSQKLDETGKPIEGLGERIAYEFRQTWNKVSETFQEKFLDPLREKLGLDEDESIFRGIARKLGLEDSIYGEDGIWTKTKDKLGAVGKWVMDQLEGTYKDVKKLVNPDAVSEEAEASATAVEDIRKDLSDLNDQYAFTQESVINSIRDMARYDKENYEKLVNDAYGKQEEASKKQYEDQMNMLKDANNEVVQKLIDNQKDYLKKDESGKVILDEESMKDLAKMFGQDDDSEDAKFVRTWITDMEKFRKQYEKDKLARENMLNINENKEAYDEFNSEETQKRYNILSKKNADNKLTVGEYEEFKNLNLMGAKSKGYLAAKQDIDSGRFGESVVVQNAMIDDNKFGNLARRYRGESPIKYDELAEKYKEVTVKKAKRLSTKLDKLKEDLKNASDSESRFAINEQIANVSEEYFNLLETNGYAAFIEREDKRKRIDEKKKELERAEIKRKAEENIDMMVKYGGKDFATYVSSIRSIKSMANRLGIKIDDSDFSDPDKTKKTVQRIVKDSLNLKNQGKISNEAFTNIAGARDQIYGGEDSLDSRIRENSNQEIGEILNKQHIWDRMGIDIGESDSEKKANKKKNRQTAISKMLYEKFGGNVMSLDDKSIFDMFKDYTDKDEDTLKEKGLSWKLVKKIQENFAPRESKDKGGTDKGGDSSDDSDDAESHAYGGRVGDMVPVTLAKGEKANGKLVEQGGFGFLKKGTKITPNKKSQRPFDAIQEKIDLFKGKMFKIKGYADGGTVDADGNVTMDDSLYEEQMRFTDQANQEYTAPKKFKSKINPDDTLVGQTIDTAKQGVNAVFNALFDPGDDEKLKDAARDVFKNIKEYAPSALAGGIVGGGIGLLVGGPLLAASAGAAIGIAKSSDKVKNWLFGDIGEDGERQGGIISKDVQQTLKQYIPDMSKYGVTGAVAGLLTPFGPVGGLMIGSAIGWAKNNAEIRQALFGDEDGLLNKERREKIKKAFPNIAIATLGTVLAGPFGGILPNAVLGAGLGLVSTTDEFKDAIFGKEDENGERHGGLLGAVKDYVIEPMKEFAIGLKDRVTEFVIENMIDPLKSAIVPIAKQGSVIVKTIFSSAGRAMGWIFDKTMASPLGIFFKEHLIEPGSKILKKLFSAVMAPAKLALTAPFKAVGYIGDRLRNRQINKGNANYMTAQERLEYRDTHPNRKTVGIFGKKDKYEEADELLANMDLEQLQDLQENIEMSQLGDKTIRKKTRDLKGDIVTAVDEFFDNSSRDRLGIPLISKTQRNRLVKLIQSGNSAKAMTLLNSLKGRDGQKVDRSEAEKLIGQFQEQGKSIRNLKANRKAWDITRKKSKSVLKDYGFKDLSGDYLSRLRDYVNTEITDRKNSNMGKNTDGANGLSGDFFQDVTEKNTDRLIQAINELNDTQTLILEGVNKGEYGGTGNERYDNKIRKRLAANDLKDITAKEKTLAVFDKMEDKIKNVLVELVGFSEDELKDIDRDSLTNETLIKFLKPFIMDGTAAANKDLVKYFFSKQGKKVHKDGKLLKRTQALWKKDKNINSQDLEKTFGLTQRQFGRVIGNMDSMNMYAADVDDKIAQGFANRNGFNLSDITDSIKRSDEYKKFANDYKSSISYDETKFNSVASDLKWNNAASEAWKDAPSSMVKKNITIFNAPFKAAKTTGGILGSLGGSLGRAWKRSTSKTYNSGVSSIIKKDPKFFELLEKSGIIKDLTNVRATQLKNFLKDKRQWSKEANDIISGKTTLDEVLSKFNSHAEGGIVGDETYGVFSPDDDEYATDENLKAFQDGILSQITKLNIKSYAEGGEVDDDTEEDEKEANENKKESVLSRLLNKIKRSDKKDKAEDKEKPEKKEARTFVERQFVPETGTYKQFLVKEGTDESSPAKIQELNTSDTEKTNKLMEMKTSKLGELFGGIKNAVGSVGTWLQGAIIPDNREDKFGTLKRWLGKAFLGATALGAIPHIVNFYNEKFVPTLKTFWNETVTPWANEHIKPFWENVVMPKFGGVVNKVVEKLDMAVNFIRTLPERIGQFTTGTLLPWFSGDKDTIEVFGLKVPSFPRLITEKIIPYYVGGFSFLLSDIVPAFVKAFTNTLPSLLNAAFQGFREIMSIDLTDLFSSGGSKRHSTMEKENPSNDKVDDVVLEYGKYSAPFKDKLKTKGDNSRAIQENKSGMSLSGKSILSNANKGSTVINNYSGTSGGSLDSGYGDIPEDEYTDPNLVNPYTGITINQQEREDNIEFKENTHTTLGDALLYGLGRNFLTGGQYGKGAGKVFGTVGDMVSRIPFIGKPLGGMIRGTGNVFDFTGQAGKNMYSVLGNGISNGASNLKNGVKNLPGNIKNGVTGAIDSAKNVLGSGSKKAASEAAEEVVEETVEKTGKEALEAATGGKGIISKITSWISDGIKKISTNSKILDKVAAAGAKKGGKEAGEKAVKQFTENITKKFLPKLLGEITSRCKKVTAKITAKFATVVGTGGIASIGFAVMDFISGYSHAASILGVDKPDFSMKCIAGMYNMLKGFFMLTALIPDEIVMNLVINYIAPALNIDTTEWEKERNEAEEAAQKYNIENGFAHMETRIDEETGEEYQEYVVDDEKAALSTSDYLEKNNQNAFTKFTGAVGKAAKGVGGLLKDNVKGAGTGAAVGTAIGAAIGTLIPIPGVGTAIGAAVGGTLGTVAGAGIQALTKNSEGVAYYPVDGNGSYYVIENQKTVKAYSATGEYLNDVDLSPDVIYQGVQEGTILTGEKVVVKSKVGQFFDAWEQKYKNFEENHKVLSTLVNASGVGFVIKAVPKIANFFRAKSAIPYYLIPTSETLDPSKVPYLVVDGEKVRCFNPNGEEEEGFSLREVFNTTTQGEKKDSKYLATATDKQLLQELIASGSVTAGEEPVKFEKSGLGKTLDKAKNMFNNVKDTITNSVNMSNEEFSKFIANKGAFGKGFAILSRGIGKLAGKIGGALKSFFTSEKITGYRYVDGNGSLYCIKDDGTVEVYNANGEKITDSKESPDAVASADEIYQLYVAGLMEEGEIVIRQSGIGKLWDKFSGKVSELWNSGKEYLGKTFEENGILGGAFKILGDGFDVALGFFGKDRKVAAGKAYVDAEGCFYAEDKTPGKYSKYNTEGRLIGEGGEYTAEELDALFQKGVLDISDEPLEIKRDSFITNTVNWVKEKGAALWDKGKEFLGSLADKYGDKAKEIGNKIGKSITNFVFGTETKTCYTTPEGDYYVPAGENVWQHYTQAGDLINTVTDADSSEAIQANINAGVYVKGTVEQPKAATFRNFLGSMGGKLKGLWSSATSLAGDAFEGLKSGAKKLGKILFGEDFGEPKKVTGWFDTDNSYYVKRSSSCFEHYSAQGTLIETITDQEACDCIQRNFNAGMYTEKEIPDPYQSVASKLIDGVKEKLGDAWEGAVSAAKAGWDWVKNTATDFWNWLTGDEEDPDDVYENAYIDEDGNVYAKGSGKPPEYTQYTPQGSIVKKLKWKKIKKLLSKGKIVKAEDNIVSEVKAREGAALGKAMSVYNEAAKKFDETADSNTSGLGKLFKGLFSDDDDSGSGKGKYGRGKYLRAKYGLGNNVIIVNESNIIGESTSNNHAIMAREIADNPQLEKEIRAKYGMANGKYSTMMDYNGVPYNAPGDTIRQTIGDSGCGIVAGVNAVNSINGATAVNVKDAAKMAIKEGYKEKNGGTKPGFFKKLFRDNGISSSMSGNKTTLENNLKNGETTVLMGINKNSGVRTPYGSKTPHYVLATGVDNSGKLIVQDPQDRRSNLKYNLRDVLSKTEFGVSTGTSLYGTGDNGFEYNDDPNMINFGTGGIMSNPEDYINEYSGAAFKFFKENGFSDAAAVGIIANAWQESSCNPKAIQGNGKGPAAGFFQWENYSTKSSRWKSLNDYATKKGKEWTDFQSQMEYALQEIDGLGYYFKKHGSTVEGFKNMTDPKEATLLFEQAFERAGKPNMEARYAAAEAYWDKYAGTNGTSLSSSSSSSSDSDSEDSSSSKEDSSLIGKALAPISTITEKISSEVSNLTTSASKAFIDDVFGETLLAELGIGTQSEPASEESSDSSSSSGGGIPADTADAKQEWAYYAQGDSRWGSKPYSEGTYASSACGPTSMAMILTGLLGNRYYPTEFPPKYGTKVGTTTWDGFKTVANDYGLTVASQTNKPGDWSKYKSEIDAGHPFIFSGNKKASGSVFTTGGHFVVSQGYIAENGQIKGIIINDPAGKSNVYTNLDQLNNEIKQLWSFGVQDTSHPAPASGDSPFPAVSTIKGAWPTEESDSTPSLGATGTASEWFTSLDGFGNVSSGYGPRGSEFHNGIDYSVPTGTKVRTPISGTIAMLRPTNTSNGYGNAVILQDADGMYHWFCHLDKFNVKEGDKVSQNDVVGLSGNTGISTGPHLHYTISSQPRGNHSTGGDIDPDTYDYTSVGSSGSGYGLGKSKVTIKTTGSKIKNAISGLGKLTAKQAIELNPDATEPAGSAGVTAYEDLNSKDKALVRKHQQMEGHSTRGSAYNGRGIGGGFDGDYSELLAVIIKLLQKIVTNTTPISGINTIVEMLSQHFDVAIEEASKKNDSEKVTKLNQIKRKLREIQGRNATMNQGTSMGFGNSLMNNDMEYLMTAMSAIANE